MLLIHNTHKCAKVLQNSAEISAVLSKALELFFKEDTIPYYYY